LQKPPIRERREGLKKQWKELRQGTLISIGSKADKGNRLTKFEDLNGQLHLRITTGNREFIYAKVLREPSSSKDKWITFMAMLLESWQTKKDFPGKSSSCEGVYGRNPKQGETKKFSQIAWQVLKVALLFPILGKVLPRDLSPLKPVLVEGVWDRVRSRLVPL